MNKQTNKYQFVLHGNQTSTRLFLSKLSICFHILGFSPWLDKLKVSRFQFWPVNKLLSLSLLQHSVLPFSRRFSRQCNINYNVKVNKDQSGDTQVLNDTIEWTSSALRLTLQGAAGLLHVKYMTYQRSSLLFQAQLLCIIIVYRVPSLVC